MLFLGKEACIRFRYLLFLLLYAVIRVARGTSGRKVCHLIRCWLGVHFRYPLSTSHFILYNIRYFVSLSYTRQDFYLNVFLYYKCSRTFLILNRSYEQVSVQDRIRNEEIRKQDHQHSHGLTEAEENRGN